MQVTRFVRSNIIAGFFFLLPLLLAIFVFSKMWSVLHRVVHRLAVWLEVEHVFGAAVISIITVLLIIGICFLAGLLLRFAAVGRWHDQVEKNVLRTIPGYFFLKTILSEKLGQSQDHTTTIVAIKVNDFISTPGILMDEHADGRCTIFVPASPNSNSGIVHIVHKDKLEVLPVSLGKLYDALQNHGKGLI